MPWGRWLAPGTASQTGEIASSPEATASRAEAVPASDPWGPPLGRRRQAEPAELGGIRFARLSLVELSLLKLPLVPLLPAPARTDGRGSCSRNNKLIRNTTSTQGPPQNVGISDAWPK